MKVDVGDKCPNPKCVDGRVYTLPFYTSPGVPYDCYDCNGTGIVKPADSTDALKLRIAVSIHAFVRSNYPNGLTKDADDFAGHFVDLIQEAVKAEQDRIYNGMVLSMPTGEVVAWDFITWFKNYWLVFQKPEEKKPANPGNMSIDSSMPDR